MKIHCGQMVEGALKKALESEGQSNDNEIALEEEPTGEANSGPSLIESLAASRQGEGKVKIVFEDPE